MAQNCPISPVDKSPRQTIIYSKQNCLLVKKQPQYTVFQGESEFCDFKMFDTIAEAVFLVVCDPSLNEL
jgi:hypothetical protein